MLIKVYSTETSTISDKETTLGKLFIMKQNIYYLLNTQVRFSPLESRVL